MKRASTEMDGFPSPSNELKRLFRSGSRKSGKFMVDIIDTERFQSLTSFKIGANAKYSAVG